MRAIIALLAGLMFTSGLSAQDSCSTDGIVLHGRPSERVIIGPETAEIEPLSPEESIEYELVVKCRDGYLIYASREGRILTHYPSGCFNVLSAASGQIHFFDESCRSLFGSTPHDYSEIIRNGVYQIIYRGTLTTSGL